MYFILILAAMVSLKPEPAISVHRVSDNLRKKLDAEERNAMCCRKNLRCCQEPPKTTTFEVKSLITECPNLKCTNRSTAHKIVINKDKTVTEKLTECNQKLLLTVKMTNEGVPGEKSQYVIIDHITDPNTLKRVRILNPYAVRIRQDPVLQVYGLQFERAVNGEPKETVYNKHKLNYRGCDTSYENPTCGVVQHEGRMVPYSTGFCCSCDPEKNHMMEAHADEVQWPADAAGVPEDHKNDPGENRYEHYKHYGFTGQDGKMVYDGSQTRADKSVNYEQFTELKDGDKRQRRGGQSCDDVNLNNLPESFHESTHCLTFPNLWYSIYQITKPQIVHRLRIQIFQKYEDCHGNTHWMDLTQGKTITIGTHQRKVIDKDFIARYCNEEIDMNDAALNYKNFKLLIPEKRIVDPEQFMMVPKKMISEDGKQCDRVGVGYEAFYKQKKRCSEPQGTCLGNQPIKLHESDVQAENEGKSGSYFLKFFGSLAEDPVGYNSTGQIQYIKMIYTKTHISNLNFELNADLVTLLKPNAYATITEIYTDATNPSRTRIIVKVTNSGLLYGVFYVRLSGCPLDVPASFNNIGSKSVLIPPQHQHIYNLYIEYPLPVKEMFCSIHVHNVNQELIAIRQIRIHTYDRCVCIWQCECACYVTDKALKCTPMSLDSYHAAGFQGGYATCTHLVENSYLDDMLAMVFSSFIFLMVTLLVMGLIKAILGLCSTEIGLWGLYTILGIDPPEVLCNNKECEFRDDAGISAAGQFCLNVMFFFLYPMALFNICIRKCCFSKYTIEKESSCSCEQRWINYECSDETCKVVSTKSTVAADDNKSTDELSMIYTPTSEEKSTPNESKNE